MNVVGQLRAAGCVWAEDEAALLQQAAADDAALEQLVQRRVAGEPLEVLLGWVGFAGLRLELGPGVFVPRGRTELLARVAVALTGTRSRALDLCCGVGAVAAVVAAQRPQAELFAVDLDPVPLRWARRNVPRAQISCGDLYQPLPTHLRHTFDVVAANAPYVPSEEIAFMPVESREHEPRLALDGGQDGTAVQSRVIAGAPDWLRRGGSLVVEAGRRQSERTAALMRSYGFRTEIRLDDEVDGTVVVGVFGLAERGTIGA